ncbi:hypothetical protein POX_f07890 [Penicillium oxalicum]|uniref:hypothetical protein n=1 Tax=Penicillium oxalicum TaxID=69781 RepID=UPI0020B89CCD|nr:hypothetical protein POX_f07890 [Penicillium oxalicum]KAI2787521.1 hypothetical protein POX_f07890 [Penicillium oxalicum]
MTSDSTVYRPTESLILPSKRRFIPFRIPNFHTQLRHYISTADPDRIYVVVERVVYAIHISSQKRESIAVIPFEPRCLAAGYGWIAVGGPENGECAFIRTDDRGGQPHGQAPSHSSDVDSALPLDFESSPGLQSSPGLPSPDATNSEATPLRRGTRRWMPEFELHKFGGSIVNSVTIHQFPSDREGIASEDVMVVSNNDRTVTLYSLTSAKVLKVLHHSTCMNYAIISPDHTVLTAVGDENRIYFYSVARDWDSLVTTESGTKLSGWNLELLRCIEISIGSRPDDACCFTIAFSQSSHLCAVGSQSGFVTVLDMDRVRNLNDDEPVINQFKSSRSCIEGGAVRCMTFAPEPWDLLVWLEGHGRAGVADVRQSFLRRQILTLDPDDPDLQEVRTVPLLASFDDSPSDDDLEITARLGFAAEEVQHGGDGDGHGRFSSRESMLNDLTARERLIMQFLNTARWNAREDTGVVDRGETTSRTPLHLSQTSQSRSYGATEDLGNGARHLSSIHQADTPGNPQGSQYSRPSTAYLSPRSGRRSSVILPQSSGSPELDASNHDPRNSSSGHGWTSSRSDQPGDAVNRFAADSDYGLRELEAHGMTAPQPSEPLTPTSVDIRRSRPPRSSSIPRPVERSQARPVSGVDGRQETSRPSNYDIRANIAAERIRRQRQIANEMQNRAITERGHREQRTRQQILGFEQNHSPRWVRNIINDLPDRSFIHGPGAEEPDATAGVGWGADGRTLYIATLEGIFEFQLNIHDRKTFPILSYR